VDWEKERFLGRDVLLQQKEQGVRRIRVGLQTSSRRYIPRPHQTVVVEGNDVGYVTSGTLSPTLNVGIALALVRPEHRSPGTSVTIAGNRTFPAEVVRLPFVKKTSLRRR
jgi:aminomethyltransferase